MSDAKGALDKFLEPAQKELDRMMAEKLEQERKNKLRRDYEKLDLKSIGKKNEAQLILWQSGFPEDSPQYQFATHELEKKKLYRNLRWLAIIALIGAFATIFSNVYKSKTQPTTQEKTISHTPEETTKSDVPEHNSTSITTSSPGSNGVKSNNVKPTTRKKRADPSRENIPKRTDVVAKPQGDTPPIKKTEDDEYYKITKPLMEVE